jgi:L-alanine-DL-glutamate epimerase-like enolase superfamily enzyme
VTTVTSTERIRVAWTACKLELAEPFVIARANVREVTTVFVRVGQRGLVGYGEARPAGHLGESADQVRG